MTAGTAGTVTGLRRLLSGTRSRIRALLLTGTRFHCVLCDRGFRRMLPSGYDFPVLRERRVVGGGVRPNARCPACGSSDRERLLFHYLSTRTGIFRDRLRVLHVAPERCLSRRLELNRALQYVTADIDSPLARVRIDVRRMEFADASFDVILCNHVLEHVPEDRQAMRELRRVLRPGGWAILQVPMMPSATTFEDPTVTTPRDRERAFGQSDHVRIYGRDYLARLGEAGFKVESLACRDLLDASTIARESLVPDEEIFRCT